MRRRDFCLIKLEADRVARFLHDKLGLILIKMAQERNLSLSNKLLENTKNTIMM